MHIFIQHQYKNLPEEEKQKDRDILQELLDLKASQNSQSDTLEERNRNHRL